MPQPPPTKLAAWRSFLEAHAAVIRRLNDDLEQTSGFPLSWYDVLLQLSEAGGVMRMHELADSLLISRSATTRFVDRLESRGFITRQVCDEDKRGMNVILSDAGRDTLRAAAPGHLASVEQLFTGLLTDDEASALEDVMTRIAASATADHS